MSLTCFVSFEDVLDGSGYLVHGYTKTVQYYIMIFDNESFTGFRISFITGSKPGSVAQIFATNRLKTVLFTTKLICIFQIANSNNHKNPKIAPSKICNITLQKEESDSV